MNTAALNLPSTEERNARAEDGFQDRTAWNSLCEGILIPLATLTAVFLVMTAMMLIAA